MKYRCANCDKSPESMQVNIIEGGVVYSLCKECEDDLESKPTASITAFLGSKTENWVMKNMREAKERREKGEGFWKSVDDKKLD